MIIFYDVNRVICGISEILYRSKWYTLLYANEDYVIIRYANKYTKLRNYEVEDTEYNTTIEVYDRDGNLEEYRQPTPNEREQLVKKGLSILYSEYDMDSIEACKRDMELIKSNDLKLYFTSGMLTMVEPNSSNTEFQATFKTIINSIAKLPIGDNRKGLNVIIVDNISSELFNTVNMILNKYGIKTDAEAIRCLDYRFILDLVYVLESE